MAKPTDLNSLENSFDTHVCIVSGQAAPNLLALLDPQLKPQWAVLLTSREMLTQSHNLIKVLQEAGVQTEVIALPDAHDYAKIQEALFALEDTRYGKIAVNVSGGTKLIALALNSISESCKWPVFYVDLDINRVIWLPQAGAELRPAAPLQEQLRLRHYLQSYGFTIPNPIEKPARSSDEEHFIQKVVTQYAQLERGLSQLNFIGQRSESSRKLEVTLSDNERDSRSLSDLLSIAASSKLIKQSDGVITYASEAARNFSKGGWLEVQTFYAVTQLTTELQIRDRACNLEVLSGNQAKNEIDIAFLAGNRLHTIECKTGNLYNTGNTNGNEAKLNKANDALYKLAENARRFGGIGTKSMLVTFRSLQESELKLAQALNLTVVHGKQIENLSQAIRKWVRTK